MRNSTPHFQTGSRAISVRRQSGATLIEVLVTVLLLSFGLVGLAGLQYNGSKFNHGSYLRSQGTALAYDQLDRMRSNLAACPSPDDAGQPCGHLTAFANAYDGSLGAPNVACQVALPVAAAVVAAAAEANQWKSCIQNVLPAGQGQVTRLAPNTPYVDQCGITHAQSPIASFIIEVNWAETRLATSGVNQRDCAVVRAEVVPQ
jgi:type IV pilus assembly protein PilV